MTILTQTSPIGTIDIPAVGFGTYLITQDQAADAVRTALTVGYRHIDTAAVYGNEAAVGVGLRAGLAETGLDRVDVFVTTKLWPGSGGENDPAKSGAQTRADFERSLTLLGLDYVDLYLIHSPHGGRERLDQCGRWSI